MLAIALGAAVVGMSAATSIAVLLALMMLIGGLGQSVLSLVNSAIDGGWFRRRLGRGMAGYASVASVGFIAAFPVIGAFVLSSGWRVAWSAVGVGLIFALVPMAWLLDRPSPDANREEAGGDTLFEEASSGGASQTIGQALRSPALWVVALAGTVYGLVASGIGLFNESILAERGFPPEVYHYALAVIAATAVVSNFVAGALIDRASPRRALVAALIILAAAVAALTRVSTVMQVMAQALAMGAAGGVLMAVVFGFWQERYAPAHRGGIRNVAQMLTLVASAAGPVVLALWIDATGSYAAALDTLSEVIVALAAAAIIMPIPRGSNPG